jgi:hypothetical protein
LKTFIHDPAKTGQANRRLGALLDETKLRRVLEKMLDEKEFLSPYGSRALSRIHAENPYVFNVGGQDYRVGYLPGESDNNSNWRGPIWMPVNALIIRAPLQYYTYYGNDFTIECPTGSGRMMNLYQVAEEISCRLGSIFLKDENGHRPVNGGEKKNFRKTRTGATTSSSTNTSRRQRRRAGCEPPDRMDRRHRPHHALVRHDHAGAGSRTRQDGRGPRG